MSRQIVRAAGQAAPGDLRAQCEDDERRWLQQAKPSQARVTDVVTGNDQSP